MSRARFVHDLEPAGAAEEDLTAELGGKAASVLQLRAIGFDVPDGFVLTTGAYRSFLEEAGIEAPLEAVLRFDASDPDAVAEAGRRARELIRESSLPDSHAEAIETAYHDLGAPPVAVRSSATDEDGTEASFAGQQETYLGVEGAGAVCRRVKDCWASLFTRRGLAYRADRGHPLDPGIAVIVQELVEADKSGVTFTVDPSTGGRQMTVEATWGLGEAVVSGEVSPDNYVVDRATGRLERREIKTKRVMYERGPDGDVVERPVPEAKQDQPVLDRQELRHLVAVGRNVEDRRGRPQDVEWAFSDGDLVVLQARPITTGDGPSPEATEDTADGTTLEGLGASHGSATGELCFEPITAMKRAKAGDDVVLARRRTSPSDVPGMKAAVAVITAAGGTTSHAAIVARELDTPAVVGCDPLDVEEDAGVATVDGDRIEAGTRVRVDGTAGIVTLLE